MLLTEGPAALSNVPKGNANMLWGDISLEKLRMTSYEGDSTAKAATQQPSDQYQNLYDFFKRVTKYDACKMVLVKQP